MSIYRKSQYSNLSIPYQASYPYYVSHVKGGYPERQYPYDALLDQKYQYDNLNPRYQYYGNMGYPYSAQRHRAPQVYYDPKPTLFHHASSGHEYKIPPYPPYIYWYPNPKECRDVCGNKVCDEYHEQLSNYRNCRRCQRKDPPQCWDPSSQMCVECPPEQALENCASRYNYGCANPNGYQHADVPPINPLYTGCKSCR